MLLFYRGVWVICVLGVSQVVLLTCKGLRCPGVTVGLVGSLSRCYSGIGGFFLLFPSAE